MARVLNKNGSYTFAHRFPCSSSLLYRLIALYECKRISITAVMYFRYILFSFIRTESSIFHFSRCIFIISFFINFYNQICTGWNIRRIFLESMEHLIDFRNQNININIDRDLFIKLKGIYIHVK